MKNKDILEYIKARVTLAASLTHRLVFIPREDYYHKVAENVERVLEEFKETGYIEDYELNVVKYGEEINVKGTVFLNSDLEEYSFSY